MIQPCQSTVLHRGVYNQPRGMKQTPSRHRPPLTNYLLYGCRRCGSTLRTDATGVFRTALATPLPVQRVEEGQRERLAHILVKHPMPVMQQLVGQRAIG